jgi:uncharacterized protein with FMN-binding domain
VRPDVNKKHPLRHIILGTAATVSSVVLLLALKQSGVTTGLATAQAGAVPSAAASAPAGGAAAAGGAGGAGAGGAGAAGGAGKAAFTGEVAQTQYGPVQVRLITSGGKVAQVEAVQAPNSTPRSKQVTADSVPKLNQQAVTARGARIDTVSGATYTSKGYAQSLQSALDKAGQ